ncbi:DUF6165 family protein [bacterium]|jgi:hypothetical protein|nr:DUF6165 family protein [bacterium]|tara:strand:+ start:692 stop:1066 length:375 start_codon:yes stop_codon:yes gene_type:complete
MQIEVSIGEIVDKLSILQIKLENITDEAKLVNIKKEFDYLYNIVFKDLKIQLDDYQRLLNINKQLWDIEDDIRDEERAKRFEDKFIELARAVYVTNDERSRIKKDINIKYGSDFVEEKSYQDYT